jgi:hypothetical protein
MNHIWHSQMVQFFYSKQITHVFIIRGIKLTAAFVHRFYLHVKKMQKNE